MENREVSAMPKLADGRSKSSKSEIVLALLGLAEIYGRELSPVATAVMAEALADIPVKTLQHACARAVQTCRFMPTVVELRELAGYAPAKPEQITQAASHAAFEAAARWVQRWAWKLRSPESGNLAESHERVPPLDERSAAAIRRLGGMTRFYLGLRDPEQVPWIRRDFVQEYELQPAIEALPAATAPRQIEGVVRKLVSSLGGEL